MENESAPAKPKPKKKKQSKILHALQLHNKGASVREIATKLDISPRLVRSYLWRGLHPAEYRALLKRYFTKRKQKKEIEEVKAAVKNSAGVEKQEKTET